MAEPQKPDEPFQFLTESQDAAEMRRGTKVFNTSKLAVDVENLPNSASTSRRSSSILARTPSNGGITPPNQPPTPVLSGLPVTPKFFGEVLQNAVKHIELPPRTHLTGDYCTLNLQERALFIFSPDGTFRRTLFFIVDHKYFEWVVLLIIFINSIVLILSTPNIRNEDGMPAFLNGAEYALQAAFTIEMLMKIFALGLVMHPHSYLRSWWNCIDCVIVLLGFVAFASDSSSISAVRLFRVLRPLKTIPKVPGLSSLLGALFGAIPKMVDVAMLMMFVITVFSILGLQLWGGVYHQRCYQLHPNGSVVGLYAGDTNLCTMDSAGHECEGGPLVQCQVHLDIYKSKIVSFDHMGTSFLQIYKVIAMDDWPDNVAEMQQVNGFWVWMFFYAVVVLGSYFCLNLVLAVLASEYSQSAEENRDVDIRSTGESSSDDEVRGKGMKIVASMSSISVTPLSNRRPSMPSMEPTTALDTVRRRLAASFKHRGLRYFMLFVTSLNILCLAMDHDNIDETFARVLNTINFACSLVFILEFVLKLFALGSAFFRDKMNIFDGVLALISIPEMAIAGDPTSGDGGGGSQLSALRAFRLARLFRMAKSHPKLQKLIITIVFAAASAGYLFLLILLFMFIFLMLGIDLMHGQFPAGMRQNFNSLWEGFLTVFIVITGESWMKIAVTAMEEVHPAIIVYFVILFTVGNYILLNLFIAILIDSFGAADDTSIVQGAVVVISETPPTPRAEALAVPNEEEDPEHAPLEDDAHSLDRRSSLHRRKSIGILEMKYYSFESAFGFRLLEKENSEWNEFGELEGNALMIFSPEHPLRKMCGKVVRHPYFDPFIALVILFNCVVLSLDYPGNRQNERMAQFFDATQIVFICIFGLEMFMKVLTYGLWRGESSYLRNNWNRLDFFVIVVSFLGFFVPFFNVLRATRCIRITARSTNIRNIIAAMLQAMPAIGHVIIITAFGFFIFGVLGVQLFKGSFVRCNDPDIAYRVDCIGLYNVTTDDGVVEKKRLWETMTFTFNHMGSAMLTLFMIALSDGWAQVMYWGIDSRSRDEAMRENERPYMLLYFVAFVVVGSFFMLNLFVGSLIENFRFESRKKQGHINDQGLPLITQEQAHWVKVNKILRGTRLPPKPRMPSNPVRRACWNLVLQTGDRTQSNPYFDAAIMAFILLNMLIMMVQHYGQPAELEDFIFYTNLIFAIIFTIEAAVKILALNPLLYFKDHWNKVDFVLVPLAYIGLFVGGPGTNSLRVFRVARAVRLIKRAKGLNRLFNALLTALPPLFNVVLLLFIFGFVFALIGVDLFGKVTKDDNAPLSEFFNFDNVGFGMVTLGQIATTEAWADLMRACMVQPTDSNCLEEEDNCGSVGAIPYFVLYMMLANLIGMNLFAFVIVDSYYDVADGAEEEMSAKLEQLSLFRREWAHVDTNATERVRWEVLLPILRKMGPPVGVAPGESLMIRLKHLDLPVDKNLCVNYNDCVHGIAKDLFNMDIDAISALSKILQPPKHLHLNVFRVHHCYAVRRLMKVFRRQSDNGDGLRNVIDLVSRFQQSEHTATPPQVPCCPGAVDSQSQRITPRLSPAQNPLHDRSGFDDLERPPSSDQGSYLSATESSTARQYM